MKKTFIKSFAIFTIIFFMINYFNASNMNFLVMLKILCISILCGGILSGIAVLLKIDFLKKNKENLERIKKSKQRRN